MSSRAITQKLPTLVIKLAEMDANDVSEAHVRVVIRECKEDFRTRHALKAWDSKICHVLDQDTGLPSFLAQNYSFSRRDPTPYYRVTSDSFVTGGVGILIPLPIQSENPAIRTYDLGTVQWEGEQHRVVGWVADNCHARYENEEAKETVVYHLNTCRGIVPEAFLKHLHEQLTGHGFTTFYKERVS